MPSAGHFLAIDTDLSIWIQITHDMDIEEYFHFADSIIGFLGNLTAETRPIIEGDAMLFFNLIQSVFCKRVAKGIDRKSTRLNSSHQIISYAVFCLKKK